jgi:hypothetical protein
MLAVRCFDDATNAEVNRSLARQYALQALARHLSGKPSAEFTVSGAREVRAGAEADGKSFALTLRVPRDGVALVSAGRPPAPGEGAKAGAERVVADDALSQRKGEYLQMIADWGAVSEAGLGDAVRKADDDPNGLAGAVAAFKKQVRANAAALAEEIKADPHLFSLGSDLDPTDRSDKDRLLAALEREQKRLLELAAAAARPRPSPSPEKKP